MAASGGISAAAALWLDSIGKVKRKLKLSLAALAVVAALAVPAGASACPCREFCGKVVAHGSSLYGVPWRITAATRTEGSMGPSSAELTFSVHACGEYSESGYGMGFSLPFTSRAPFFSADSGSEIDAYPEGDLSGVTSRGIVRLALKMSDGSTIFAQPQLAPRRLWSSLPWVRRLRFFDQFFAADLRPLEVVAFDRAGEVLGRGKSMRGIFEWQSRQS